ncbi:MAG: phenylacetate--CoA ligase family protein, partial [Chloroflexi bacterium]|nr:phenylacetate--CoA ligase family protein [Chloroflexota bacterium]
MTAEWPPAYDPSYVPPADQEYWDPALETMPPQERDALIVAKLQRQAAWAYERSPFYRNRWGEAGFHPDQINTLDDVQRIPIITKEDLRQDLLDNPPFGSNICDDWQNIQRIHGSSGTTGIPTIIA